MAKFLIVQHNWFMDSLGFSVKVIEATDENTAKGIADSDAFRAQNTFRKTACKVIPLAEGQEIARSRKLTWKERITGKIA